MSEWSNERPSGEETSPWAPTEPARPPEPYGYQGAPAYGPPNPYAPEAAPPQGPPTQHAAQYGYGPYGPPNQYGYGPYGAPNQHGYGYQYGGQMATGTTDALAIVSLVLSLAGLAFCPLVFGPAALICGYIARRRIRQADGRLAGKGLALAGIIIGWVQVVATVGIIVVMIIASVSSPY